MTAVQNWWKNSTVPGPALKILWYVLLWFTAMELTLAFMFSYGQYSRGDPYLLCAFEMGQGDFVEAAAEYRWTSKTVMAGLVGLAVTLLTAWPLKGRLKPKTTLAVIVIGAACAFLCTLNTPCGPPRSTVSLCEHTDGGYISLHRVRFGFLPWLHWERTYFWTDSVASGQPLMSGYIAVPPEDLPAERKLMRKTITRWGYGSLCGEDVRHDVEPGQVEVEVED